VTTPRPNPLLAVIQMARRVRAPKLHSSEGVTMDLSSI
jgi:hypothetical protein